MKTGKDCPKCEGGRQWDGSACDDCQGSGEEMTARPKFGDAIAELLPCPFCGGTDGDLVQGFTRATDDFAYWSVECINCGCEIADDESQASADAHWNRRTSTALPLAHPAAPQIPTGWIGWSGGVVPVQGTDARGFLMFQHESLEDATARGETVLDHWPWFREDERPMVVAYLLAHTVALQGEEGDTEICPSCDGSGEGVADTKCNLCGGSGSVECALAHPAAPQGEDGIGWVIKRAIRSFMHAQDGAALQVPAVQFFANRDDLLAAHITAALAPAAIASGREGAE